LIGPLSRTRRLRIKLGAASPKSRAHNPAKAQTIPTNAPNAASSLPLFRCALTILARQRLDRNIGCSRVHCRYQAFKMWPLLLPLPALIELAGKTVDTPQSDSSPYSVHPPTQVPVKSPSKPARPDSWSTAGGILSSQNQHKPSAKKR